MSSLTKNPKLKNKQIFLIANNKTFQIFWAFEQLSSTYCAGVTPAQTTGDPAVFVWTAGFRPAANMLRYDIIADFNHGIHGMPL